jgi:hypothetical protein
MNKDKAQLEINNNLLATCAALSSYVEKLQVIVVGLDKRIKQLEEQAKK